MAWPIAAVCFMDRNGVMRTPDILKCRGSMPQRQAGVTEFVTRIVGIIDMRVLCDDGQPSRRLTIRECDVMTQGELDAPEDVFARRALQVVAILVGTAAGVIGIIGLFIYALLIA